VTARARLLALSAAVASASASACSVDDAAFRERVFTCDTAARDPLCGTDRNGQPMTCFPASQLDGADFCAPSCGEVMRLSRIDPTPSGHAAGETTTFECTCGDDYRRTIRERI